MRVCFVMVVVVRSCEDEAILHRVRGESMTFGSLSQCLHSAPMLAKSQEVCGEIQYLYLNVSSILFTVFHNFKIEQRMSQKGWVVEVKQ
jgi:hypothetical protein